MAYGIVRDAVLDAGNPGLLRLTATAGGRAFINTQAVGADADSRSGILSADNPSTVLAENKQFHDATTDAALVFNGPATGEDYIRITPQHPDNPFNTDWLTLSRRIGTEVEPSGSGTVTQDSPSVDTTGKVLAVNDDTKCQDSTVAYTLTGGQYYVVVVSYDAESKGAYRVTLSQR